MKFFLRFSFLITILVFAGELKSSDIQSGETFADGQAFTAARANNAINGATILPAFVSGKSTASPVAADSFLFYQNGTGTLLRTTYTTLQSAFTASATFTGTTTFNGATVIQGVLSPTQITSSQNDYAPTSLTSSTTIRVSSDAARTITGISGGTSGLLQVWHNVGSFNITFSNADASSSIANRFDIGRDYVLAPSMVAVLQYDSTSSRWRVVGERTNNAPSFTTLTDAATVTWTLNPANSVQNAVVTLAGSRQLVMSGLANGMTGVLKVIQDGTGSRKLALHGPSFTDGVGNNTTTFTSATAAFVAGDVGRIISQSGNTNIPAGTTISSRTNGTTVVLSATCTTANPVTFYLPGRTSLVTGGGAGAASLTTTASATDILTWIYDGTYVIWQKSLNAN